MMIAVNANTKVIINDSFMGPNAAIEEIPSIPVTTNHASPEFEPLFCLIALKPLTRNAKTKTYTAEALIRGKTQSEPHVVEVGELVNSIDPNLDGPPAIHPVTIEVIE